MRVLGLSGSHQVLLNRWLPHATPSVLVRFPCLPANTTFFSSCFKLTLGSMLAKYQNAGQTVFSNPVPQSVSVPAVRTRAVAPCACVLSGDALLHP